MMQSMPQQLRLVSCIFVAFENPTNSHYWSISPMQLLNAEQAHEYATFHDYFVVG